MKKNILTILVLVIAAAAVYQGRFTIPGVQDPAAQRPTVASRAQPREPQQATVSRLRRAIENRESDVQVEGAGVVIKLLPDDLVGSRHQRILLSLDWGGTLLISHNIDLAPRVEGIRKGDTLSFFGEYVWNDKGGLVHWTHHDPGRRHVDGWLKHAGETYQ